MSLDDLDTVTTKEYQEAVVVVSKFSQMISALPETEDLALTDEEAVKEARTLYDGMTTTQKGYVSSEDVKKLEAAEARIKEIKSKE